MTFEINISEKVAKADKLDIEHMRRYYAARNINIVTNQKLTTGRECQRCGEYKTFENFEQYLRKNGRPSRRASVCRDCHGTREKAQQIKTTAAQQQRDHRAAVIAAEKARAAGITISAPPPIDQKLRSCETCNESRPAAEYIDRFGITRDSCTACRGLCLKPPYGTKTCPGCGQEKHRQEFRMKQPGRIAQGRPFQTCLACRHAKG